MNLINTLFEGGKAAIDKLKRPFIIDKLKRSFESADSSAREKEVDQEIKIQKLRLEMIEDTDKAGEVINKIVACRAEIRKARLTAEIIEEERSLMFDEAKDQDDPPSDKK